MKKAQASLEMIVLTSIGLLVLAILISFIWAQIESNSIIQSQEKGVFVLDNLNKNIKEVYFSGVGTTREIEIEIPEFTDFEKSIISGSSLLLNIYGTDFISNVEIALEGNWPTRIGKNKIILTSFSDFVGIYPPLLNFNPTYLNQTINQGLFKDINLDVTNLLNENKSYLLEIEFENDFSSVSSSFDNQTINFLSKETKKIPLLFSCDETSAGAYNGQLNFISDLNISLPITVNCVASQTKLTSFPKELVVEISDEEIEEEILVCNNSNKTLSVNSAVLNGTIRDYTNFSFSGDIEQNRCEILILNFNVPLEDGEYFGELIISAGGLLTSSDITLIKES